MKVTATVLAKVEDARFQKAVEGLRNGTYQVTVTLRDEEELRGLVKSAEGKAYGCMITQAGAFCSCPDALYRGGICKHTVLLALHEIRTPSFPFSAKEEKLEKGQKIERPPNLKLGKARRNFTFSP